MKRLAKDLKSDEVFTTNATVFVLHPGNSNTQAIKGNQVADLKFKYVMDFNGKKYAWCKLALYPSKIFFLVALDSECEVKASAVKA